MGHGNLWSGFAVLLSLCVDDDVSQGCRVNSLFSTLWIQALACVDADNNSHLHVK